MKKTINFSDFVDSFSDTYKNNFSYEGKQALFDYLENYEEETGETIELDPIALCCEYEEFNDIDELRASYPDIKDMDDLRDNTQVIEIEGTDKFIIQKF